VAVAVAVTLSDAVAIAIAVAIADANAVALAIAIAVAVAIAIAVLIAITIAVIIADAVTIAVAITIAVTNASSSCCLRFSSSASPFVASTSFQPPIVSWHLLFFAGRLIVTSLRHLCCPIYGCCRLIIVLFVAPSTNCQQVAAARRRLPSAAHPRPHHRSNLLSP
jgi:hypothetical protein